MPFGLTNAPATFQREMNRILLPLIGKCLFVYIDDIVVYSTSIEKHLEHLKQVFEIFSSIISPSIFKNANFSKSHLKS